MGPMGPYGPYVPIWAPTETNFYLILTGLVGPGKIYNNILQEVFCLPGEPLDKSWKRSWIPEESVLEKSWILGQPVERFGQD